jgi:hypothetical protein
MEGFVVYKDRLSQPFENKDEHDKQLERSKKSIQKYY